MNAPLPDTPFWLAYQGSFRGLLHWHDVEAFWLVLAANPQGWYLFDPEQPAPDTPLHKEDFPAHLAELQKLIGSGRESSHCFALFADGKQNPAFVKIFDPANLGATCGSSGERTLPRWVLSRIEPDALPVEPQAPDQKGLVGRILNLVRPDAC